MAAGHVHRRGSTWSYIFDLPKVEAGKRRQKKLGGFPTKKAAQEAMNRALVEVAEGTWVAPSGLSVAEYLEEHWLPKKRCEVREQTAEQYSYDLKRWVVPTLGHVSLARLTPRMLSELYSTLGRSGGQGGRPLTVKTVQKVHRTLHAALNDAVKQRLLRENPATDVRPPKDNGTKPSQRHPWTPEELAVFLAAESDSRLAPLWCLAANWDAPGRATRSLLGGRGPRGGTRPGRAEPDDRQRRRRQARAAQDRHGPPGHPRHRSNRPSPSGPEVCPSGGQLASGRNYEQSDFVFTGPGGGPLRPDFVTKTFAKISERSGPRRMRLHDLRHMHATHLMSKDVNAAVVQRRLGHSHVAVTLGTYTHPTVEDQRAALRRLEPAEAAV